MNTNITTTDLAILVLASTAAMLHAGGDHDGADQLTASLREVDLPGAIQAATAELAHRGRLGLGHVLDDLDPAGATASEVLASNECPGSGRWLWSAEDGRRLHLSDTSAVRCTICGAETGIHLNDVAGPPHWRLDAHRQPEDGHPLGGAEHPAGSAGQPERCPSISPPVSVTVTEDDNGERSSAPVAVRCDQFDGHDGDHRGRLAPPEDEPTFTWVDHEASR